jgi:hypothetical protein
MKTITQSFTLSLSAIGCYAHIYIPYMIFRQHRLVYFVKFGSMRTVKMKKLSILQTESLVHDMIKYRTSITVLATFDDKCYNFLIQQILKWNIYIYIYILLMTSDSQPTLPKHMWLNNT